MSGVGIYVEEYASNAQIFTNESLEKSSRYLRRSILDCYNSDVL